jgi:hypothetical protein
MPSSHHQGNDEVHDASSSLPGTPASFRRWLPDAQPPRTGS